MSPFFSFVKKEFYHILRDKRTMLILLGMPIVEIILFGFALTNEVKNVRVAVYAPFEDETVRRLNNRLDANENLKVTTFLSDPREAENLLRKKQVDLVVIYESPFNRDTRLPEGANIQLIADATDANIATLFTGYAVYIIQQELQPLLQDTPFGIQPDIKLMYNPGMKSSYNFVPGVMGMILMLLCAMMTSISIVREKETGTMEVLLVSPIQPFFVILAKTIPYFVLSCINMATILLLARFLLHVPIIGNLTTLLTVSLLFILVSLSLGILISTLVKTQVAAMLMSGMILMMPVMVFSGLIYPTENMPWVLRSFSDIIPAKWYIRAIRKIMIEGLGFAYVWKEIVIMAGMVVLLTVVSIVKFKNRLE
ncbi:MAG: ABC transporter permease [Bacteroidales bacterium]